ncbi:hypothetical protein XAR_1195 [Xanthomonas citri pv. glycines str. 8ra]|nr:hypothetical protein XAR_1195 [Xanthomonas citri pv. glycines str. 8ra]
MRYVPRQARRSAHRSRSADDSYDTVSITSRHGSNARAIPETPSATRRRQRSCASLDALSPAACVDKEWPAAVRGPPEHYC